MKICICGPFNPGFISEYLDGTDFPTINSGASAVNIYVKALLEAGHELLIITSSVPGGNQDIVLHGNHIKIIIVRSNPGIYLSHAFSRYYMISRIKECIKTHIGEFDLIHAQWTYDFAYAAKSFCSVVPVFCTVRDWAPRLCGMLKGLKKLQWEAYRLLSNTVLNDPNVHLIANSQYILNNIKEAGVNRDISLVGNPIEGKYILERKKCAVYPFTYISIANGASSPWKNILGLLKAFQIVKRKSRACILKLVGNDFEENNPFIRDLKDKGFLEGVLLLGHLSHDEMIAEIDNSSCLVHPSLEESFGNIFLEGMARCVPVIGGIHSGAVPLILGNGEYGFLCDVADSKSLAETMLYVQDTAKIQDTINNASSYLKDNFSEDIILKKHIELYERYI